MKPTSISLTDEMQQDLERHVAIRRLAGEQVNRSDVIREAIENYLDQFRGELVGRLHELASEIAEFQATLDAAPEAIEPEMPPHDSRGIAEELLN